MINVCIPTLNSYDTLIKCIESIRNSSIKVDKIIIIDNSARFKMDGDDLEIHPMPYNLGVAASWNWFINNIQNHRIISNDDIIFDPYAIEQLLYAHIKERNSVVFPENLEGAFSCFLLPDEVISVVGKFDETISPNYAYFEDNDYFYRMSLCGISTKKAIGSFVEHIGSSTIKHMSIPEETAHHRKFRMARQKYIEKWGGEPNFETFKTPYNRG